MGPAVQFGFLGLFTLAWAAGVVLQRVPAATLLIPVGIGVFAYLMMRWLVFPLSDEVLVEGNEIIGRNRGEEDRFPVTNIMNVEGPLLMNPEPIILTLREPCRFGRDVVFSPRLDGGR